MFIRFYAAGLPSEMQALGNNYARDEFKRHTKCKPAEANVFLKEWTNYAIGLSEQLVVKGKNKEQVKVGSNFAEDDLKLFTEDQIVQLYELSQAATGKTAIDAEATAKKDGKTDS